MKRRMHGMHHYILPIVVFYLVCPYDQNLLLSMLPPRRRHFASYHYILLDRLSIPVFEDRSVEIAEHPTRANEGIDSVLGSLSAP